MLPHLKRIKIGFVGAGNMTRSLVSGLLSSDSKVDPENLYVSSRSNSKAESLAQKFSIKYLKSTDLLIEECDWIVLSMKPQDLPEFLASYGKSFDSSQSVISLCAGISYDSIKRQLPDGVKVLRMMPSTAAEFSSGVLGLYSEEEYFEADVEEVFKSVGSVQLVENEELLDGIMISAASGVGFMLEFLQIWSEWLEEMGFSKDQSQEITKRSFMGVASILKESQKNFFELQSEVTSKKGVTLAGLEAMRAAELDNALNKGFQAALRRSRELSELV